MLRAGMRSRSASRDVVPSRERSPNHVDAVDAEVAARAPRRANSFGLGLGGLTQLASKAGDAVTRASSAKTGTAAATSAAAATTPGAVASQHPHLPNGGTHTRSASATVTNGSVATPGAGAASAAAGSMAPPMTPDASHLSQLSLRLSELVNRAFHPCSAAAGPVTQGPATSVKSAVAAASGGGAAAPPLTSVVYEGRRLPVKARIQEIADLIVGELRYAAAIDPYLLRAVSRQVLKSLTLFADRLDSLLVAPIRDPSVLFVPCTLKEGKDLPPALEYNLGVATLGWILEDALERCIEGTDGDDDDVHEPMPHFVAEILTPVRKKMEGTILHVIQPVLTSTKRCLVACVARAVPRPFDRGNVDGTCATAGCCRAESASSPRCATPSQPDSPPTSWHKELEGRLEGCRRLLLHRIEERTGKDGEGWYISVAVHVIWKGLLVLTSRAMPLPMALIAGGEDDDLLTTIAGTGHANGASAFAIAAAAESIKRTPTPAQLASALRSVRVAKKVGGAGVGESRSASGRSTPVLFSPAGAGAAVVNKSAAAAAAAASNNNNSSSSAGGAASAAAVLPQTSAGISASARAATQQVADLQTFERLMLRFVAGFTRARPGHHDVHTPSQGTSASQGRRGSHQSEGAGIVSSGVAEGAARDDADKEEDDDDAESESDSDDEDELARAALEEALLAIRSTILVAQFVDSCPDAILDAARCKAARGVAAAPTAARAAPGCHCDGQTSPARTTPSAALPAEVCKAAKAIPPLLLLHLVYSRMSGSPVHAAASGVGPAPVPSPPALFGLSWAEYDRSLVGFGAGLSWATALAKGWKQGIETAWRELRAREAELAAQEGAPQPPATPSTSARDDDADAPGVPRLERASSLRASSLAASAAAASARTQQGSPAESEVSLLEAGMTQSLSALPDERPGTGDAAATPAAAAAAAPAAKAATTTAAVGQASSAAAPRPRGWGALRRGRSVATPPKEPSPESSPSMAPEEEPLPSGSATPDATTATAATTPSTSSSRKFRMPALHLSRSITASVGAASLSGAGVGSGGSGTANGVTSHGAPSSATQPNFSTTNPSSGAAAAAVVPSGGASSSAASVKLSAMSAAAPAPSSLESAAHSAREQLRRDRACLRLLAKACAAVAHNAGEALAVELA